MGYGFVYILTNEYMPSVVKIGCTERSPHARADELSKPTGVPVAFEVLCYVEVANFQAFERQMHEWFDDHRVNEAREFFSADELALMVACLWHTREKLSFSWNDRNAIGFCALRGKYGVEDPWQTPSPWVKKPTPEEEGARADKVREAANEVEIAGLIDSLHA